MRLGQKIKVWDNEWDEVKCSASRALREGTVVYIHPSGRWFTVQFPSGVRTSLHFTDLPPLRQ